MQSMRELATIILAIVVTVSAVAETPETGPVVRLDPALDEILPANAKIEKLAGNLGATEGPLWIRKGGYLIFSDFAKNTIYKFNPADGKVSVFLERPDPNFTADGVSQLGGPNGIAMDPQGRIVFGIRDARQIVRLEKDGRRTVLASQYEGKRLNSGANDLVYKSNGSLYFTDPPFGLRERRERGIPEMKWDLPFSGVFLLKDGKVQLLNKDVLSPNGIAFSPDEKYLYVNDNAKKRIMRFEVQPDDTIAKGQVFIDMSSETAPGNPDGMKVDLKGNVYSTGPGGIWIISPAGKHLGTLVVDEHTRNFAFGDADGKSLYVTGGNSLYRVRLKVAGIRP